MHLPGEDMKLLFKKSIFAIYENLNAFLLFFAFFLFFSFIVSDAVSWSLRICGAANQRGS